MAKVSRLKVFEAAETIRNSGLEPSVRKVRELLDGGSFDAISDHLRVWRSEQFQLPEGEARPDPIQLLVSQLYDQLKLQLEQDFLPRVEAQNGVIETALGDLEAAELAIHDQKKDIDHLKSEIARLEGGKKRRDEEIGTLKKERDSLANSLSRRDEQLSATDADLVRTRKELDVTRGEQKQYADEQARLLQRIATLDAQLAESKTDTARHTQTIASLKDEIQQQKTALAEVRSAAKESEVAYQDDITALAEERATLSSTCARLEAELTAARNSEKAARDLAKTYASRLGDLESRIDALRADNEQLRAANVSAQASQQAFDLILAELKSYRASESDDEESSPGVKD